MGGELVRGHRALMTIASLISPAKQICEMPAPAARPSDEESGPFVTCQCNVEFERAKFVVNQHLRA